MKSKNYNYLIKDLKVHDEQEMSTIVNERIDKVISKSDSNAKSTLEALICLFDGVDNISNGNTYISLAYALFIGIFTLISMVVKVNESMKNSMFIYILIVSIAVVALLLIGLYSSKQGQKRGFILNALKFKYEELKQNELVCDENKAKEIDKLIYSEDESIYIVKVKKNK